MLQDQKVMGAVSRIVQRSERQEDAHKILDTYVDVGLLTQLLNNNNQIFYGRRGTGKTHVMKVLGSKFSDEARNSICYIDGRTLGSSSQFSDDSLPIGKRCLALFRDIFITVYYSLLERIVNEPTSHANEALKELDVLLSIITQPVTTLVPSKHANEHADAAASKQKASLSIALSGAVVKAGGAAEASQEANRRARSFLLPRALEKHPTVQKLFDARVLHHMQRGYADKDKPGVRYNIYAIDYGTYVDLMGTSREPEIALGFDEVGPSVIVPFDDKRSIRRIVLDESILL